MTRVNRLLATVVALGLVVVGVLTIVEVALLAAHRPGWAVARSAWDRRLATSAWSDTAVWAVGVGLVVVGLAVVVVAWRAARPRYWRTTDGNVLVSERTVRSWAERAAHDAHPDAEVRVDLRRARVTVRAAEVGGRQAVEPVHAALSPLQLDPSPSVRAAGSST